MAPFGKISKRLDSRQSTRSAGRQSMPVSSPTSRTAVSRSCSSPSWLPVTDCQKPGCAARSSSRISSCGVWMTTSTETGFFGGHGSVGSQAMPSACISTRHQKGMPCSRQSLAACSKTCRVVTKSASAWPWMPSQCSSMHQVAFGRPPGHVGEAVGKRVEVVAEPVGKVQRLADGRRAVCSLSPALARSTRKVGEAVGLRRRRSDRLLVHVRHVIDAGLCRRRPECLQMEVAHSPDPPEGPVVVVGVVALAGARLPHDDAPRAAIACARASARCIRGSSRAASAAAASRSCRR